jgi:hypothetical protein
MLPFSQVIEEERRRWMPFRRALLKKDQVVFDRMLTYATQQFQTEVHLGRPWTFEAVLMAVLIAHERLLEQVRTRLAAFNVEKPPPDENPHDGGR